MTIAIQINENCGDSASALYRWSERAKSNERDVVCVRDIMNVAEWR